MSFLAGRVARGMSMIQNLQTLRALAALLVVFVHLDVLLSLIHLRPFGQSGVDLFFVISGFVMVHTTLANPPTPAAFARNRVARIVPIYWLMTLGVFSVALIAPTLLGATRASFLQLAKSLLFIPFTKANGNVQPVLFVGWTLNYEMFFYALFSVGLMLKRYYVGLAFVIGALMLLTAAGLLFHPQGVLEKFYTNPIMIEFAFGMGVALLTEQIPEKASAMLRAVVALSLLAIPLIVALPLAIPSLPSSITAGVPSAVLVTGCVLMERWGWTVRNQLMLAIGDASYVLYLSHPYVTQTFQKASVRLHPSPVLAAGLICVCLAFIVLVALLLHRFIERPLALAARQGLGVSRMKPRPA